jgi:hypothetical protein
MNWRLRLWHRSGLLTLVKHDTRLHSSRAWPDGASDFCGAESMSNKSRGRLYVDKDVQRALVVQLVRHWALFVAVLTGILLALDSLAAPQQSFGDHFRALWNRHAPLLVTIVALFPVFVYDSFKLSNRFAGPILRLRKRMQEAAAGEPVEPLQFRPGDYWQDLAENFNVLAERLEANDRGRHKQGQAAGEEAAELVGAGLE